MGCLREKKVIHILIVIICMYVCDETAETSVLCHSQTIARECRVRGLWKAQLLWCHLHTVGHNMVCLMRLQKGSRIVHILLWGDDMK